MREPDKQPKVCSTCVFFLNPRYRSFANPNCRFTPRNACSIRSLARRARLLLALFRDEVVQGLWCKVCDLIEQARYLKRMRGG